MSDDIVLIQMTSDTGLGYIPNSMMFSEIDNGAGWTTNTLSVS
jgi:hypothetical protein